MTITRRDRTVLAGAGALLAALALGGATFAATLPSTPASTHASGTAVLHAAGANAGGAAAQAGHSDTGDTSSDATTTDTTDTQGTTVSAAAQSSLTGGAHDNHGGYVSCIARGGTGCDTTTPTLPSHGQSGTHGKGH